MDEQPRMKFAGVFELLGQAWRIYKERFWVLLQILIVPMLLLFLPKVIAGGESLFWLAAGIAWMVFALLFWLAAHLALLFAVQDSTRSASQAFREALKAIPSFFGTHAMRYALVFVGFLLFIVPGIIFSFWFALTSFVFVDEEKRGWSALQRSRELMSKMWTPVLWRHIALGLLFGIPLYALSFSAVFLPQSIRFLWDVLDWGIGILVYPFFLVYGFQVYRQVKSIKEAGGVVQESVWKFMVLALLLVLVFGSLFVGVVLVSLGGARTDARDARLESEARFARFALELHYGDNESYPQSLQEAELLQGRNSDVLSALEYEVLDGGTSYSLCVDFEKKEDRCFGPQD